MTRSVTLLGSTGSVGVNTLRVAASFPNRFRVAGLAAGSNLDLLYKQIEVFSPKFVYLDDEDLCLKLAARFGRRLKVFSRKEGLRAFAKAADADILVAATSGTTALLPVIDAIGKGRRIALANKEILVIAGELVMQALKKHKNASLVPVDSEHSAIFQCLQGENISNVRRIILTSSGGPLHEHTEKDFLSVSKEVVINHPKWKMGRKISVDSATLMNKGLEIIEASWLFGMPIAQIDVIIHPEAVIHSMVEFKDGSTMAQLGVTDMRLPIQYALSYPDRLEASEERRLDWSQITRLNFQAPDRKKFPCLDIAYAAARRSGTAPCVLSAADEIAVGAYLEDRIRFVDIPNVIEKVLSKHRPISSPDIREIQSTHDWAVEEAKRLCQTH